MKTIQRRSFLSHTAKGTAALIALSYLPKNLLAAATANQMAIGFQTFPIRDILEKDFTGTMKTMAEAGYTLTEMCSPKGYESIGYGYLVNVKPDEIKKMITDAGLKCPSCHFGFGELTDHLEERIEWAQAMGLTQMICSTFWLPKEATLNDYLSAADKLNVAAEKIKKAGMQCGFHNHEFEFHMLDGQLIYDALMKRFDADLVKMQFQTEVINLGYKAADYFKKYPGRFISSHLSDWTKDKKEITVGQGVMDWKEFFAAVKIGGIKNLFVEMDMENMKGSARYIHAL